MHSPLASPAATRAALEAHGLATKKSLGQNFLIDDNVVGRILDLTALVGSEHVLEVGPGLGTLTLALAARASRVTCVERDTRLQPPLARITDEHPNVRVLFADALDVIGEDLASGADPPVALVANLPYAVAATVLLRAFETMDSVRFAVVMVQAEVADRIGASPGSKEYGAYSVKLALRARMTDRFGVSRTCFMPPPNVDSAVVRMDRVGATRDRSVITAAARMADAAFSQRRKTIRNALRADLGVDTTTIEEILAAAGVDGDVRAETLGVQGYVDLGRFAREYGLLP